MSAQENEQELQEAQMGESDDVGPWNYAAGSKPDDMSEEAWEPHRAKLIEDEMNKDYIRFASEIGSLPPNLSEDDQAKWKQENYQKLVLAKRKAVSAYALQDKNISSVEELEALLDSIEQDEEITIDIDRGMKMTDEEWSNTKKQLMAEAEKEDEKERGAVLAEGSETRPERFGGFDEKVNVAIREDIPEDVRRLQKKMCALIYGWWEQPQSRDELKCCVDINTRLEQPYRLAPSEMALWLKLLWDSIAKCEKSPSEANVDEMIKCAITLTNKLRNIGLDWKMVISKDSHRRVIKCLQKVPISEELAPKCQSFFDSYCEPRKEQLEILKEFDRLASSLLDKQNRTFRGEVLPYCIEASKVVNGKLGQTNDLLNIRHTDHNIPTADLITADKHYRLGNHGEAQNVLKKFAYKLGVLRTNVLPDLESVTGNATFNVSQAQFEILGMDEPPNMSHLVEDIPLLETCRATYAYEGVEMRTVAWGARFYINQYGPITTAIFRIESHASPEWTDQYGNNPPPEYKVTETEENSRPKYSRQAFRGIHATAFEEMDGSLDHLNPEYHDRDTYLGLGRARPRFGRAYSLAGYDLHRNGLDTFRRWECRTEIRRLCGLDTADIKIYNVAAKAQNIFESWIGGKSKSRNHSEGSQIPLLRQNIRLNNLVLKQKVPRMTRTTRMQTRSMAADQEPLERVPPEVAYQKMMQNMFKTYGPHWQDGLNLQHT